MKDMEVCKEKTKTKQKNTQTKHTGNPAVC